MIPTTDSAFVRLLICGFVLLLTPVMAWGQVPTPDKKLALNAVLVLTPEFCAAKNTNKKLGRQPAEYGKAACAELEPALKAVFSSVTTVSDAGAAASAAKSTTPGQAQVLLVPRVADFRETVTGSGLHGWDTLMVLEWTAIDTSGTKVWIESVQCSEHHARASIFAIDKARILTVENVVKDAVEQSAAKMSSAPELRKLQH
jgi:hypothetical protein